MTETPRDQQPGDTGDDSARPAERPSAGTSADEPVTGPPAGSATGQPGSATGRPAGPAAGAKDAGSRAARTGASPGRGGKRRGGFLSWLRPPTTRGGALETGPETDPEQRRRRRWFVAGISAGAALIVVALCAGTVGVVSAVGGFRDHAGEVREDRRVRDADCLSLEQRLNKLNPPGATTTPQARATAVRDENAAVRIYVGLVRDQRGQDGWRELLDARTTYAEALEVQAASRTPAFFVAPRTTDGRALAEQLERVSPAACGGPIRRLSAPDL